MVGGMYTKHLNLFLSFFSGLTISIKKITECYHCDCSTQQRIWELHINITRVIRNTKRNFIFIYFVFSSFKVQLNNLCKKMFNWKLNSFLLNYNHTSHKKKKRTISFHMHIIFVFSSRVGYCDRELNRKTRK